MEIINATSEFTEDGNIFGGADMSVGVEFLRYPVVYLMGGYNLEKSISALVSGDT